MVYLFKEEDKVIFWSVWYFFFFYNMIKINNTTKSLFLHITWNFKNYILLYYFPVMSGRLNNLSDKKSLNFLNLKSLYRN